MRGKSFTYAFLVFCAGAGYGIVTPLMKGAYAAGYTWQQMTVSQGFFGMLIFGVATLWFLARRTPMGLDAREVGRMLLLGVSNCLMVLLYSYTLTMLSAAMTLTLLFQFVWMGLAVQLVSERRGPRPAEAIAVAAVLLGTLLASGVLGSAGEANLLGIVFGLLTAASYTVFLHFSGKVGVNSHWSARGFWICVGIMVPALPFCPDYFTSGVLLGDLSLYGLGIGLVGQFIPVLLLGLATPHLATGIVTVMAASELPVGIIVTALALGEPVDALMAAGVVAVLAGIVVMQAPGLVRKQT